MLEDLGKRIKVIEEKLQSYLDKNHKIHNELNCQLHKNEIFITGIPASISDYPISSTSRKIKSISVNVPKSSIISARKVRRKSHDNSSGFNIQTYSMIAKLSSKAEVDEVIRCKYSYQLLSSNKLFTFTTNNKFTTTININRMFPSILYKLFLNALTFSKLNNLPKTYIKDYTATANESYATQNQMCGLFTPVNIYEKITFKFIYLT